MSKETKKMMKMILMIAVIGVLFLILNSQFGRVAILSGFQILKLSEIIMKVV
ncbi:MAG: hypothetical protein JEZ08_17010 [Clostridiales bacterium]|nr:hypothetical protein [Clostridiales bacterium]